MTAATIGLEGAVGQVVVQRLGDAKVEGVMPTPSAGPTMPGATTKGFALMHGRMAVATSSTRPASVDGHGAVVDLAMQAIGTTSIGESSVR